MRDNCARDDAQEHRIKQMQEGLVCFLERCDPVHPTPVRPFATTWEQRRLPAPTDQQQQQWDEQLGVAPIIQSKGTDI